VQEAPPVLKQSRAKIWIRTGILAVFGLLFGLALYHDVAAGLFPWWLALAIFVVCLPLGFWLSRLVPMQVHLTSQAITFSFDRIYFALILLLVVLKAVAGRLPGLSIWADVVMCVILGLMVGRLSGICLRVRGLKVRHNFVTGQRETRQE
jgi:hypothetical protein